jgi:hypothetical protein
LSWKRLSALAREIETAPGRLDVSVEQVIAVRG